MIKNFLKTAFISSLLISSNLVIASSNSGEKLINKLTQNQVNIDNSFKVSQSIEGFVISPKKSPTNSQIIFVSDGKYIISGNIINENGENLTQTYYTKYIEPKQKKLDNEKAVKAYKNIENTNYFTEGKDSAPHKIYMIMEPNCSMCHLFYENLKSLEVFKSGQVQAKFIMVAFLKNDSAGKSANILLDSKTSLSKFSQDEKDFNNKNESGGIKAIKNDSPQAKIAFEKVNQNTKFFIDSGFTGTPTILYKDKNGNPQMISGAISKEKIPSFLQNVSNKF